MVDHLYSIGINRYDHHRSLTCCTNDAKLFERTLRGLVPSVRSQVHIDDVEPVGRQSVESLLDEVESLRLGADDSLFFFFAGHGSAAMVETFSFVPIRELQTDRAACLPMML